MSFFFSSTTKFLKPAKQECDNRNYDEDYHGNFCNFHREPGYPLCTQQSEYQGQYKEYNGKPDQDREPLPHYYGYLTGILSELDNPHHNHYQDG
jgi:hypothetical protein